MDLLLERDGRRIGVEFKCSDAPTITKSMHVALQDLKLDRLLVVYPGRKSYPIHPKAAAMPLVFIEYDRSMTHDPEVAEAVRRAAVLLCHPDWAARLGILCDPEMPWAAFSTTATGFGGLTLAELVKPGVIYLKSAKLR